MHLHYFTLLRQVEELCHRIEGTTVTESFTQVKNEWVLKLEKAGEEPFFLQLSTDPQYGYFLANTHLHRRQNSTDVFSEIIGQQIQRISVMDGERIIRMEFQNAPFSLYLQYFPVKINFFLVDQQNTILRAFKHHNQWHGRPFEIPDTALRNPLQMTESEWLRLLEQNGDASLKGTLTSHLRYFTRPVVEELFYRAAIPPESHPNALTVEEKKHIFHEMQQLFQQFLEAPAHIYFDGAIPLRFTLGTFHSLSENRVEIFEELNNALKVFCFQSIKWRTVKQKKETLQKRIEHRLRFLERTINKMAQDSSTDRSERYRKIGQLLLAQPHAVTPHTSTIEIIDYFDPQQKPITVKIDPRKTAAENAEMYFEKAKASEQNREKRHRRLARLKEEQQTLQELAQQLQEATTEKALNKIEATLKALHVLGTSREEAASMRVPYREFHFNGYTIWVGKSASDNDQMTFKHAHKEDWWLHVQGYAGSHVIISNPRREDHPPPAVQEYAARLAVTFSQARHAQYVPVLITKVKYVRKPRKAPPGSVIPQRTKTIFADPLPEHEL